MASEPGEQSSGRSGRTEVATATKEFVVAAPEGAKAGVSKAAASTKAALGSAGNLIGNVYETSAERATVATDSMSTDGTDRLVRHGRRTVEARVSKQPVEALLLAGAIGYLVGWAMRLA